MGNEICQDGKTEGMEQRKPGGLERFSNLDGLRTYAAIMIVFVHVYTNGCFLVSNPDTHKLIVRLTYLVQMFFILSGFVMCCGYYEKIKNNTISLNEFYGRRYRKIWPFFAFLVFLDLIAGLAFGGGIRLESIYMKRLQI